MTRYEFDREFAPLCRALKAKATRAQADYFFEAFRHADRRDLALVCRELAGGKIGQLPDMSFFRENLDAAHEMHRLTRTPTRPAAPPVVAPGDSEAHTTRFAQCCAALVHAGRTGPVAEGCAPVTRALADADFAAWCTSWSPDTTHGLNAKQWLESQCALLVRETMREAPAVAPSPPVPEPAGWDADGDDAPTEADAPPDGDFWT